MLSVGVWVVGAGSCVSVRYSRNVCERVCVLYEHNTKWFSTEPSDGTEQDLVRNCPCAKLIE